MFLSIRAKGAGSTQKYLTKVPSLYASNTSETTSHKVLMA